MYFYPFTNPSEFKIGLVIIGHHLGLLKNGRDVPNGEVVTPMSSCLLVVADVASFTQDWAASGPLTKRKRSATAFLKLLPNLLTNPEVKKSNYNPVDIPSTCPSLICLLNTLLSDYVAVVLL